MAFGESTGIANLPEATGPRAAAGLLRWMIDATARELYDHAGVGGRDAIFFASVMGHHSDVGNAPVLAPERCEQFRSLMRQSGGWISIDRGGYEFQPRGVWDRTYVDTVERALKREMSPEHRRGLILDGRDVGERAEPGPVREMALA